MPRITDKLIRAIPKPLQGQKIERDNLVTGFGVRKTATGHTAFIFNYTINGRDRRMTIGEHPAWSVVAARQIAAKLRMQVDAGEDPLQDRQNKRRELTLSQFWDQYEEQVLRKRAMRTQADMKSLWRRIILPKLGKRRLSDIGTVDVEKLFNEVSKSTPVQANRCLATIRHVFNKAIHWEVAHSNPVVGITPNPEEPRQRYLDENERARFLAALDAREENPSTLAIRFLFFTGARRGETLSARWKEIDLEAGIWIKPSAHTKQKRVHRVPLSKAALDVLERAQQLSKGEFVFAGQSGNALTDIKKTFAAVRRSAHIDDFRLHDLRHSYASALVSRGTSLPIIGGLLGHTQVSTTARYSHLEDEAMRAATNLLTEKTVKSEG